MFQTLKAQDSVIPAVNADIVIPGMPLSQYGYLRMAADINNISGNAITGVVIEEQDNLGFPAKFKFVLYNGIISTTMSITSGTLIIGAQPNNTPYPTFTRISYPDIVLLNGGTKAVITFDTDDPNFGAYWVEYNINPFTLIATQNLSAYGGCVPVTHAYTGNGSFYAHAPRVVRSNDGTFDMFAIVAMQDVNNTNVEIPTITYFEDIVSLSQFNSTGIVYKPAIGSISGNHYYNPDIAVGRDLNTNEVCSAVSYVEDNVTNPFSYTVHQVEFKPLNSTLYTSNYTNTLSTFYAFSPSVINPRICAPPIFNTSPTNDIPFGLCYSNAPLQIFGTNPNLYYAHFSSIGLNTVNPDAQNAYATSYNGEPVIEYMQDTPGQMAREACMAWSAILNVSGTTKYGIYALMDPFVNNTFYDWSQVNFNTINTTMNIRYCTAISGTWENGMDRYVIAWLADDLLFLKIRTMHTTNYKENPEIVKTSTIDLYPNPAQNEINLLAKPNQTFTLYNVSGATVRQGRTQEGGLTRINTQALLNGVYFLYLDGKTVSFTVKH